MCLTKWLAFELRDAIEPHDGAYNDVANFKLLPDSAGCSGRNDELRLHFSDDLSPDVPIRQLRAVLRHVGIRLEHDDRLAADRHRPVCTQALCLACRAPTTHLSRDRRIVVSVRAIIVPRILAGCQYAAQRMAFIDSPGDDQYVSVRQFATLRPARYTASLGRKSPGPRHIRVSRKSR